MAASARRSAPLLTPPEACHCRFGKATHGFGVQRRGSGRTACRRGRRRCTARAAHRRQRSSRQRPTGSPRSAVPSRASRGAACRSRRGARRTRARCGRRRTRAASPHLGRVASRRRCRRRRAATPRAEQVSAIVARTHTAADLHATRRESPAPAAATASRLAACRRARRRGRRRAGTTRPERAIQRCEHRARVVGVDRLGVEAPCSRRTQRPPRRSMAGIEPHSGAALMRSWRAGAPRLRPSARDEIARRGNCACRTSGRESPP